MNAPRTDAGQAKRIAIVVRHADLIPEAVQTALQFRSTAHDVAIYLLEPAVADLVFDEGPLDQHISALATHCCCNHQPTAERLGVTYASFAAMAEGLAASHWVLTY